MVVSEINENKQQSQKMKNPAMSYDQLISKKERMDFLAQFYEEMANDLRYESLQFLNRILKTENDFDVLKSTIKVIMKNPQSLSVKYVVEGVVQ